ncbi:MAG TPA: hypothetical protein VLA69_11275 [Gaiellaceae bacterium]|jgi:hypothetical protein|nr:hypothetical protein [Gaiellaceae bacterium]
MDTDSSPVAVLRALAERQGVHPTDEDLEGVSVFLETVLQRLTDIETALPPETPPAGEPPS